MSARKCVFTCVQTDTSFEERAQTVTVYEKRTLQKFWIYKKEVGNLGTLRVNLRFRSFDLSII
jgi:hypothetical protein